ncbi:MAG: V4R domain-containing protein [Candidatus Bathyarchaeia archaeon]
MKEALEEKKGFFLDFETFAQMKMVLEKTFASGAAVILATMAKPCGQGICRQIKGRTKTEEEALDQLSELMEERNWGELSFFDVDFERGSGKAVVKNSFEARKSLSKSLGCHFFANFIAGFISELFTKNVTVKEEKCAGKGDAQCEFKF